MHARILMVMACCCTLFASCDRASDMPARKGATNYDKSVAASWIVGKWNAENGTSLEFKADGTFEQVFTETVLAPGQVIYDEESAKKAQFTKATVTTVGTYRWIDQETMEIERPGLPAYNIKVKSNNDELFLIGEGGRQDRLHRNER